MKTALVLIFGLAALQIVLGTGSEPEPEGNVSEEAEHVTIPDLPDNTDFQDQPAEEDEGTEKEVSGFLCPLAFGSFPDPTQCDAFYQCEEGKATPKLCQDGLLYHEADEECLYPHFVDCGERTLQQIPDEGLDPECTRAFGYFSDPELCDVYYLCEDGKAQVMECQDGLLFTEDVYVCDFPQNVDCGNRTIPEKSSEEMDSECLRANGVFEHNLDCNKYYHCVNGTSYELQCGPGLIFVVGTAECMTMTEAPEDLQKRCASSNVV